MGRDHAADLLDQSDLAAAHPERVKRLSAMLTEWRAWAKDNALPSDDTVLEEAYAEDLERLRSLGYIQ